MADKLKSFAVVTGASSGIGYQLASQFAQNGFDVLVVAEDNGISDAARRLSTDGSRVESLQADLANFDGVETLCSKIHALGRPLDAIAINAGVGVSGPFAETRLTAQLNLVNLNVTSAVHLTHRVLEDMLARRAGRILFTSSIAATSPGPFMATYNASKSFLKSFAEAIRNELKDSGITVTTLMPGATETNFFNRAGMEDTKLGASEKDDAAEVARDGFEALMAGKDHVVAGSFKNKIQATVSHIIPDTVAADMHRKQSEPGSADKR
ncbi:MAG TPA: SDR family NAD(P)-dependent oxidoreductase [Candidatus Acidoferrales bacterium]|jgi:short-subunit dehydrogenase|nr:SDR family NAD(P)-dependent oxidoreductase [Candidatus Acidoferrales bacterium]